MRNESTRSALWGLLCGFLLLFGSGCGQSAGQTQAPPLPLTITSPSQLPQSVQGQSYSVKLQASGGVSPYTWSTQLLGISGMTLAADGTLSGTPSTPGTFFPTFIVTDSTGMRATKVLELDVIAPLAFITPAPLPDGNVGLAVYTYIGASGGVQPYTFTLASGSAMPPGLTLTSYAGVGLIQGTPTSPGAYSFTIQVTDSFSPAFKISRTFTLNVLNNLVLPKFILPDAVQNVSYREQIQPAGGTPPYQFVLSQNSSLPPGLLMDGATGIVSGLPTTATQYWDCMLMTITDSAPAPASIYPTVCLTVQPPLSIQTTSFPDGVRGLNYYNGQITVTGGRAPYALQVTAGALPDGLSLSPGSFFLTGTPTKDGSFGFTLQVSDSYETPNIASKDFQIRINDPLTLSGPAQVQILYNQSVSVTFPASGGVAPYTWTMNSIPPGLTFDTTTGTLTGTPAATGVFTPGVYVKDTSNPTQYAYDWGFSLYVAAKLQILTHSLPTIATGSKPWLGIAATGGAAPYQWSISPGALPPGLSFSTHFDNGMISGSPTTPGTYTFTLNISDGNTGSLHQTTSQELTLAVMDRGLMTRNDTIVTATPVSNISLLASVSPYGDSSSSGPDVDVYSASAAPGSIVQVYVAPIDFSQQPSTGSSLQPVMEIVDATGVRYQTCAWPNASPGTAYNLPCASDLPGLSYLHSNDFGFQVPGSGTTPVTFYIRISDARGDARPDFFYTFGILGVN